MDLDFTGRRSRILARLSAYTVLAQFLFALAAAVLPLQLSNPASGFAFLSELIDRSALPVVALVLLFHGLAGDAAPAVWEVRLVGWLRPILRLVAVLYLLTIVAVFGLGQQVEQRDMARLNQQFEASQQGIAQLRGAVEAAPDSGSLQRLLAEQPAFEQALRQEGRAGAASAPLVEQKKSLASLIDRAEANLRAQDVEARANTSGNFLRQALRLACTALVLALFYLAAALIWPRSVASTLLALRDARRRREEEELQADEEFGPLDEVRLER